jgi:hypothetical protein
LLSPILADDAVTRGLGDPEARILVEWLVDRAEELQMQASADKAREAIQRLCRRARSIGRFVTLWNQEQDRAAACQLAATERFSWPLPSTSVDPCDLMQQILEWEVSSG